MLDMKYLAKYLAEATILGHLKWVWHIDNTNTANIGDYIAIYGRCGENDGLLSTKLLRRLDLYKRMPGSNNKFFGRLECDFNDSPKTNDNVEPLCNLESAINQWHNKVSGKELNDAIMEIDSILNQR